VALRLVYRNKTCTDFTKKFVHFEINIEYIDNLDLYGKKIIKLNKKVHIE